MSESARTLTFFVFVFFFWREVLSLFAGPTKKMIKCLRRRKTVHKVLMFGVSSGVNRIALTRNPTAREFKGIRDAGGNAGYQSFKHVG